jgi:hypothetical protein
VRIEDRASRTTTSSAAEREKHAAGPALPASAAIVSWRGVSMIARTSRSSPRCCAHDSSAGCALALDGVEMQAIAPEVEAAGEHEHPRRLALAAAPRPASARHCAVDIAPLWNSKASPADRAVLFVADLAPARRVDDRVGGERHVDNGLPAARRARSPRAA